MAGWQAALPEPGTERQLFDLATLLVRTPFDRTRPLWELTVIEGLEGHPLDLERAVEGNEVAQPITLQDQLAVFVARIEARTVGQEAIEDALLTGCQRAFEVDEVHPARRDARHRGVACPQGAQQLVESELGKRRRTWQ